MGRSPYAQASTVVLTTEERFGLYAPVVGRNVDVRFSPEETAPLQDFLVNCAASGGNLVILDEAHFLDADGMLKGLEAFLDDPDAPATSLGFIFVSSQRVPGDSLLYRLASYCGIYDLVYACDGPALSAALGELLRKPNTRHDVLELLTAHGPFHEEENRAHDERLVECGIDGGGKDVACDCVQLSGDDGSHEIKINIKIEI